MGWIAGKAKDRSPAGSVVHVLRVGCVDAMQRRRVRGRPSDLSNFPPAASARALHGCGQSRRVGYRVTSSGSPRLLCLLAFRRGSCSACTPPC